MHNPMYDVKKDKNNIEEQQQLPPQQPDEAIPPYYLYVGVVPLVACVFMCTTYIYFLYIGKMHRSPLPLILASMISRLLLHFDPPPLTIPPLVLTLCRPTQTTRPTLHQSPDQGPRGLHSGRLHH